MNEPSEPEDPDAAKLSAILVEMQSLWARVSESANPAAALDAVRSVQQQEMERQYARLLETRFTWWQVLCSPVHVWRFKRERAKPGAEPPLTRADWHQLNGLVVRIQFGYFLEPTTAVHLRRFVASGILSARDTWRLTHSLGCRVTANGLAPAPVNSLVAAVGLAAGIGLCTLAVLFGVQAIAGVIDDCRNNLCSIVGSVVLGYALAHLAPLIVCCTWGRRDAARALERLLKQDPMGMPQAVPGLKRPLLARLTW